MTGRAFPLLAATLSMALLGGCGPAVDDPANPPKLGNWKMETRLDAVSINSMNIGRDMLAQEGEGRELLENIDSVEEQSCIEPSLNDDREMLDGINSAFDDCRITDSSTSGASRHAELACTRNGEAVHAVLDMSLDAESGHSRIRATVSKPKPTGGEDRMSIMINETLTRTGDCS